MTRKRSALALGLSTSLALLACGGSTARADFFDYTTTPTLNGSRLTTVSFADGNAVSISSVVHIFSPNQSPPVGHLDETYPGLSFHFGAISAMDGAATTDAVNFAYSFKISVYDYPSILSGLVDGVGTFTVNGTITGSIGNGHANLVNTYTSVLFDGAAGYGGKIGPATYNFSFPSPSFLAPGNNPATSGAFIGHFSSAGMSGKSVPEPMSLALLGLGLGLVGLVRRPWSMLKKAS